jgi:hypothetical protein
MEKSKASPTVRRGLFTQFFICQDKTILLELAPFAKCDGCRGVIGPFPQPTLDEQYVITKLYYHGLCPLSIENLRVNLCSKNRKNGYGMDKF